MKLTRIDGRRNSALRGATGVLISECCFVPLTTNATKPYNRQRQYADTQLNIAVGSDTQHKKGLSHGIPNSH
jgi:hypothetical protein